MNTIMRVFFLTENETEDSLHLTVSHDWKARSIRWLSLLSFCGIILYQAHDLATILMSTMLLFVVALYEQFEMRLVVNGDSVMIERHPLFSDVPVQSLKSAKIVWNISSRMVLTTNDGEVVVWVPPTFAFTRGWKHPGTRAVEWLNERINSRES